MLSSIFVTVCGPFECYLYRICFIVCLYMYCREIQLSRVVRFGIILTANFLPPNVCPKPGHELSTSYVMVFLYVQGLEVVIRQLILMILLAIIVLRDMYYELKV